MADWKDTTGYSRGDTERTPRTWEIAAPDLRIIVSRWIHAPGSWFLTCAAVGLDRHDMLTDDAETAKAEALRLVATRTAKIAAYASRLAKGGE